MRPAAWKPPINGLIGCNRFRQRFVFRLFDLVFIRLIEHLFHLLEFLVVLLLLNFLFDCFVGVRRLSIFSWKRTASSYRCCGVGWKIKNKGEFCQPVGEKRFSRSCESQKNCSNNLMQAASLWEGLSGFMFTMFF